MTATHPRVLVTGGAGYIGSHVVLALRDAGFACVVLDDLRTASRRSVPADTVLHRLDVGDGDGLARIFMEERPDAVVHLAASTVVSDSLARPLDYFRNNTAATLTLLETMADRGVRPLVFSSTAAVYGVTGAEPVDEDAPTRPINPYGSSKLMAERIIAEADRAGLCRAVSLRYFNVAGADPAGRAGQDTRDATALVKVACEAAIGRRDQLQIYGDDFATPDGTCVRDYVHVSDIADAHVAALRHLLAGGESLVANVGYGRGYSVKEVVAAVERVLGRRVPTEVTAPRPGDPPSVVAATDRIRRRLDWTPRYADLEVIVRTALDWESRKRSG
jgi:UDP-glucose 4-epimerase